MELEDFRRRFGREPDRTWSAFCTFFPDLNPTELRARLAGARDVDVVPSVKPFGAWAVGGYYWLEEALKRVA